MNDIKTAIKLGWSRKEAEKMYLQYKETAPENMTFIEWMECSC